MVLFRNKKTISVFLLEKGNLSGAVPFYMESCVNVYVCMRNMCLIIKDLDVPANYYHYN